VEVVQGGGASFSDDNLGDPGVDFDDVGLHLAGGGGLRHESEAVGSFLDGNVSVGGEGELENPAEHVRESSELLGGETPERLALSRHWRIQSRLDYEFFKLEDCENMNYKLTESKISI